MKTLISICAAFILLFPLSALSQRRLDRFTIGQYNFEINLPSRPADAESDHVKLRDFELHGEVIEWELDDKRSATIGIYAPSKLGRLVVGPGGRPNIIAAYAEVVRAGLRKQKLTISESPYTFSGSKGIEFRGTGGIRVITRLFFVGVRLFDIKVSDDGSAGFDRYIKILDSFRLLTKAETIAALKWENDIEPVSQSRPAISLGNDVQAAGLKGNVCSVIDEVVTSPSTVREMDRESYYDPTGNLVREISYSRGYPQEITQWGWIDGKRISSTKTIFYLPPEGPFDRLSVGFGPTTGMMGAQERDKIYGLRHEYSYDDKGRLTEHKAFTNERALKWTRKFTYSAAGREILTLDNTDSFLTRFFETFDKNGNIAEYKVLDMGGRPYGSTVRFVYEFDQGGNWIVRKDYAGGAVRPKPVKPASTVFRTITYCD